MNQENEFSSRAGQRTVTAGQLLLVLTEILEARGGRDVDVGIDLGNKDYRTIVGYQYAPIGEANCRRTSRDLSQAAPRRATALDFRPSFAAV
jgi:hypothetical protein